MPRRFPLGDGCYLKQGEGARKSEDSKSSGEERVCDAVEQQWNSSGTAVKGGAAALSGLRVGYDAESPGSLVLVALRPRGPGVAANIKKRWKTRHGGQVDEGKEDGKVILPAVAPTPRPTLFHALVGPSAKKQQV